MEVKLQTKTNGSKVADKDTRDHVYAKSNKNLSFISFNVNKNQYYFQIAYYCLLQSTIAYYKALHSTIAYYKVLHSTTP